MYSEKEYNKLVDEHFEETQKLKSDMSVLETEKSLDEQVKKLKDELAKKSNKCTAAGSTRTTKAGTTTTSTSATAGKERRAKTRTTYWSIRKSNEKHKQNRGNE